MTTDRITELRTSTEVAGALARGDAVVALESTVYSTLGLPAPDNRAALERCIAAIRDEGAVPAVTAVIDGRMCLGIEDDETDAVLTATAKTAERDLPVAMAERWSVGVTTVSASLAIAARADVAVFATGGIGGVHRDSDRSGDVSADLGALARHSIATISAGAKSFLDLPRTLEHLETLGVPVVGWQTDTFPAFTARSSGLPVTHRVDDISTLAHIVVGQRWLGGGLLIVNPVPVADALDQDLHDRALEQALAAASEEGLSGPAVTPFILERMAQATEGRSVPANLSLVENNARLAGRLAAQLADA